MLKISKVEIKLAFDRFIIDAEDDFFLDPLRYKDLSLVIEEILSSVLKKIKESLQKLEKKQNAIFAGNQFFDWDVPKSHYVVRHAVCLHPLDRIIYNFILNRISPYIETNLSKARYSYRIKNQNKKRLFGKQPTKNWLQFKQDAKEFFEKNRDFKCLVSTDIAGFYEYTHISHFKNKLRDIGNCSKKSFTLVIELLNSFLKYFSPSRYEGIPQNYDASSYLASAFLDFLDKELEARSFKHFRYVDDIKVACKDQNHAQKAILEIIHALRRLNLNLATAKTEIWKRSDDKFIEYFRDFPSILNQIDSAVIKKNKKDIDNLLPGLISLTKRIMKKGENFDERLFRACIWRIKKCHWFRNIRRVNLNSIGKRCLRLLDEMPGRTDVFTRFLELLIKRKFIQSGCAEIINNTVYSWQEHLLWELLTKAIKIKDIKLLSMARSRVRNLDDTYSARNYAIIFLGKHGTYQDREYIASIVTSTNSFITKRCALIALQEYPQRNLIFDSVISTDSDVVIKGLAKYLKQIQKPEYVIQDRRLGSDLLFFIS